MVFSGVKRGATGGALLQVLLLNGAGALLSLLFVGLLLSLPAGVVAQGVESEPVEHRSYLEGMQIITRQSGSGGPIPEGGLPVSAITILPERTGWEGAGGVYVQNNTTYQPDYEALLQQKFSFAAGNGPQVLLYHTHTTEAYSNGLHYYLPETAVYNENNNRNIVSVGDTLAAALERFGVDTLHETTRCDTSFNQAYAKSLQVAQAALERESGVQFVVDLHRDSMITAEGVKYRPVVESDGMEAAQLMLVVGSPQSGLAHADWQQNLATAMRLYLILEELCPGIMRPISISTNRYNQHISPHALLVEVGSCGNTLEQAQLSAEVLAEGIAQLISN